MFSGSDVAASAGEVVEGIPMMLYKVPMALLTFAVCSAWLLTTVHEERQHEKTKPLAVPLSLH